jgi:hypothetical protein
MPNDERAAIQCNQITFQLMGIEEAFVLEMISVNSSRSDFGAVLMMTCFILLVQEMKVIKYMGGTTNRS